MRQKKGLTVPEILAIIAIGCVLIALLMPAIFAFNSQGKREKIKRNNTITQGIVTVDLAPDRPLKVKIKSVGINKDSRCWEQTVMVVETPDRQRFVLENSNLGSVGEEFYIRADRLNEYKPISAEELKTADETDVVIFGKPMIDLSEKKK